MRKLARTMKVSINFIYNSDMIIMGLIIDKIEKGDINK
jgi:hypothetical protein